jgi:ABC-type multidrug transport system fused ATPase/permease subunit
MELFNKLSFLFSKNQKKEIKILIFLLFIGMLLEIAGLGIMIPAFSVILNNNISQDYPFLVPYLNFLGNPSQIQLVVWGMSLLVLVYLLKSIFLFYLSWRQNNFSAHLSESLGQRLLDGYLKQPYIFHIQKNSASLQQYIQHEVSMFNNITVSAILIITEFSMALSIAIMLLLVEPIGALSVTVFLSFFAYLFSRATQNKLLKWGNARQFHIGLITKHLLQALGGIKDVKISGNEQYFSNEFKKHNLEQAKIIARVQTLSTAPRLYLEILAAFGLCSLVIAMVLQNKPLSLLLPILSVFALAAFRLMPSINRIMASIQTVKYSQPVINLLFDELTSLTNRDESLIAGKNLTFNHKLSIENIDFKYPNAESNVLHNISLEITKGKSIGFVGKSGSGKSTLVDLIMGLMTPNKGAVLCDGENIFNNLKQWRKLIGYVPQTIYLTDDTLRRNIAFGVSDEDINDNEVLKVLELAQLKDYIDQNKMGLDANVGERGVKLSGGQRQRIGIARALYMNPDILIFDEATSSLDTETEKQIVKTIKALHGSKTILIIAHRLSTVEHCDVIYEMNKGVLKQVIDRQNILS